MSNTDAGSERNAGAEGASQATITAKTVAERVRGVPQFGDDERDKAAGWLAEGRDKLEGHLVLSAHHHMCGVRAGTSDYLSIRDNEGDNGSYVFRDYLVIDERTMQEAEPLCLAQLPLAAKAVQHAVQAVTLAPKEGAAVFALERAMEGLIDAGGTLLAIAASQEESAPDSASEGEEVTPPTSEA